MIEYKTPDGVTVRLYTEYKYLLPLFNCTLCKNESYYFSNSVCDMCRVDRCRSCDKKVYKKKQRILYSHKDEKDYIDYTKPFLCLDCYDRWFE